MSFPVALLVTLAVEVPLYAAALGPALRLTRSGPAAVLGVAVNVLTHPVLWWWLGSRPTLGLLVVAELAVWVVETGLVWLAVRRAVTALAVVCAGANAASILAGLLISAAF